MCLVKLQDVLPCDDRASTSINGACSAVRNNVVSLCVKNRFKVDSSTCVTNSVKESRVGQSLL
eukprot:TRINITY_DN3030_c0_g1_i3.p2 TRINITY_DN3030_c0_g1~~TRINITY_DN3030_c0_g1_i3.p2  ORF type:complete len:63 (-),score=6.41 TRINITY_DN3030_c0_g1_i3:282-470(-)